jgi:hypothetical protein
MSMPPPRPSAVFTGSLGDRARGTWSPAQVELGDDTVTLWVSTPAGWEQVFRAPAQEVQVKSAAQRITLVLHGRSYPILADPGATPRALRSQRRAAAWSTYGRIVHGDDHRVAHRAVAGVSRGLTQAGAARAFEVQGGSEFLAASRASGARVSRLGYGPILAIGCAVGLLVPLVVLLVMGILLSL